MVALIALLNAHVNYKGKDIGKKKKNVYFFYLSFGFRFGLLQWDASHFDILLLPQQKISTLPTFTVSSCVNVFVYK